MKQYVIIDKATGNVKQTMMWSDERDFPSDWPLQDNEEVVIADSKDGIDLLNTYSHTDKKFYVIDMNDNDIDIIDVKEALAQMENELSEFQEATWAALGIDESKLPQVWQDRLNQKRALREQLKELTA